MSEKERTIPETGEGPVELTDHAGPGDPGRSVPSLKKEGRRTSSSSETQFKVERAQKCLENAAIVSKRIKEHRRATAQLLGKTFDDELMDAASDVASVSTRTGYSAATADSVAPMSVQDALNIPGISESLANTLKQKEVLMERIKQYKEISKRERPAATKSSKRATPSIISSSVQEEGPKKIVSKLDPGNLQITIKEKEKTINLMQVKIKGMETTILDLQEKISEKDSLIEAKNKATCLMSDNLSKKEKDSVNLLEDTRQQMLKMQDNFVAMENEWKLEKNRLLSEIDTKNERIRNLEEANTILESARFEVNLANSKISEDIELKNKMILDLEQKLSNLSTHTLQQHDHTEEEKGSQEISSMAEMSKRLELLEQLNCQIKKTNLELENKLTVLNSPGKTIEAVSPKKSSPQVTRKRGKSATRNTGKTKSPWASLAESSSQETSDKFIITSDDTSKMDMIVQSLNKELLDKEYIISEKDAIIQKHLETITLKEKEISSYVMRKTDLADVGLTCNILQTQDEHSQNIENKDRTVEELYKQLNDAENKITALNEEMETANKNMLKVKSSHKLKIKQLQKTIDNFSKMSDSNAEVSRLSEEVNKLTQKIAELEEEKGNLQLHLVDYDSGHLSETDIKRKLKELEILSEARLKAIAVLETQKFDLVQELHVQQQKNSELEDKISDLQQQYGEQVALEIKSVQLEEQLDQVLAAKNELEVIIDNIKMDKEHSKRILTELQDQNLELSNKLDAYLQENIELTDRLEKLSAEKISSAESIEMVESLTVQEKLELEEYNKNAKAEQRLTGEKLHLLIEKEKVELNQKLIKLSEDSEELNKKVEMFTQERHEVMEKMSQLRFENEHLQDKINELILEKEILNNQLDLVKREKDDMSLLNSELSSQIEILKIEHREIVQENVNVIKRLPSEEVNLESESTHKDSADTTQSENTNVDEKPQASKAKPSKQMTKDILKLKNIIKEREAEIADCQMKILSLEEQHQKLSDVLKNNLSLENNVKLLTDENATLKEQITLLQLSCDKTSNTEIEALHITNGILQSTLDKLKSEYAILISTKDTRINELEILLTDYERKISQYNDSLQDKDKEIVDYLNQISQLNCVSQKLKSTIELLEEEKLRDSNGELIKNLNVQILNLQNIITERESKIKLLEEERNNLSLLKSDLSEKNISLECELQKLYNTHMENEIRLKELEDVKIKHDEEISKIMNKCKEKDEEIHEIKLQLRKESIENENLRKHNNELTNENNGSSIEIEKIKITYDEVCKNNVQLNENIRLLEIKNKELMDKLKKFAANIKKKANICTEQENKITILENEIQQKQNMIDCYQSEISNNKIQELEIQVLTLFQEKSSMAEQLKDLENNCISTKQEINNLMKNYATLTTELNIKQQEALQQKTIIDELNHKLLDCDINNKHNLELCKKVSELELEVKQKHDQIASLSNEIEIIQEEFKAFKFGQNAKIQEKDLFIENLESENFIYRNRICRLEESISAMEEKRYSLERKADQLGSQLEEKQKAYSQYSSSEDELVNRLAVLMDHDQVVEKQLQEIEKENYELQNKIQNLLDDNKKLIQNLSSVQEEVNYLRENLLKTNSEELHSASNRVTELELQLRTMVTDHQAIIKKQKDEIHNLENEFHIQIENNIKEKKTILEKYEKAKEYSIHLESELQKCTQDIKTLNANLEELNKINFDLQQNTLHCKQQLQHDYTEQYVTEINNLQATINQHNSEIDHLRKTIVEYKNSVASLEIALISSQQEIQNKDQHSETWKNESNLKLESLQKTIEELKFTNKQLENVICSRDCEVSPNSQVEKVELFQPCTSATAENIKDFNLSLYDYNQLQPQHSKQSTSVDYDLNIFKNDTCDQVEELIVPKKAYLCFGDSLQDRSELDKDPFCSEEGWNFGEKSTEYEHQPDHTKTIMVKMAEENDKLKLSIANSNTKLAKAMKKLKDLKLNNEKLGNELKKLNQISELNILDSTIETELKSQIEILEKKIESTSADLIKERREKDALNKQNEVIKNANDKFLEVKEKLENEVVIWKHKFNELTNKFSSYDWEDERGSGSIKRKSTCQRVHIPSDDLLDKNTLLEKIDKENDELNSLVEQLRKENSQLLDIQGKQKDEILKLTEDLLIARTELQRKQDELNKIQEHLEAVIHELQTKLQHCDERNNDLNYEFNKQIEELKHENQSLHLTIDKLNSDLNNINIEYNKLRQDNMQHDHAYIKNVEATIQRGSQTESPATNEKLHLQEKTNLDLANALTKIGELQIQISVSKEELITCEAKCESLQNNLDKLNSENDQLLSTVTELRTSLSAAVDQRVYEVAEMWKQHLAQRENDFVSTERDLREQITVLENKYENLLDNVQSSSQDETNQMIALEQLSSIQSKLKDKEEHLLSLQTQHGNLVSQMEILRAEMEDEKIINDNKFLNYQEENEKQQNDMREIIINKDSVIHELNMEIETLRQTNHNLASEINALNHSSELLKNDISELTQQIRYKDADIQTKMQEFNVVLNQRNEEFVNLRTQLFDYEKKLEDLTFEKESELAVLRLKLHDQSKDFEDQYSKLKTENSEILESLTKKINECTALNKQINDLNKTLHDDSNAMSELKSALESQEIEIVTLKDEINKLQTLLETSAARISKHVTFASNTKPAAEEETDGQKASSEIVDIVPKAELDLALYMLYQRDMRCEELTMELTSLLEERDTLQLRLSDCLRSYEEIRAKYEGANVDAAVEVMEYTSPVPAADISAGPSTNRGSASDAESLQNKLTELRSVRHARDYRLRQDSERRDLDMQLLQRDVSRLPPEAADQLRQAHYNTGRDSQSTSTVLMNWLMGKTTPKVVHM